MTCNIGANKPEEYGKFFQWGDVEGELVEGTTTTRNYDWKTEPFNNGALDYDETYFATVSGDVCPNGVLAAKYDAASVATNGVAHMPTSANIIELTANTTSAWTQINGVSGVKLTSKKEGYTDKYIFIPASGYAEYFTVNGRGAYGYYWSSDIVTSYLPNAYGLYSDSSNTRVNGSYLRYYGRSVRGVVSK